MKKGILLIFMLFALSGCSCEYSLVIDDDFYHEKATISSDYVSEIQSVYDSEWPQNAYINEPYNSEAPSKIEGVSYYDIQSSYDGKYHVQFQFDYPRKCFDDASGVRTAFPNFSVTHNATDQTVTLDSGTFQYQKFTGFTEAIIHVTVMEEVTNHNASMVSGNVYTWKITPENEETIRLLLTFREDSSIPLEEDIQTNQQNLSRTKIVLIILGIFMIFVIGVFVYNYQKRNKSVS